ncbi:MAG: tetratricopeptide repeat protein [Pirellula sp.]
MNNLPNSSESNRATAPGDLDSKFLSRFSDTDALFVRPTLATKESKAPSIALERFQQLEQSIRNTPASPEPYIELGQIYIQQNRHSDARRVLDAGYSTCSEYEPLLVLREDLILYQANQMVEQARTAHAQIRDDENKYALEQAEINYANERIRVCRDRFNRHPDQHEILVNWAIGLRQLARFDEAIDLLTKAAARPELRSRASLQLGMCFQTLHRPLEALAAFRKAALFREPAPEPKIRQRALELALDLAEEFKLIDSAKFYAEQLLIDCDKSKRPPLVTRLEKLRSQSL